MKQLRTVIWVLMVVAVLTQAFTTHSRANRNSSPTNSSQFNYARFMASLWLPASQNMPMSGTGHLARDYGFRVVNDRSANVIINYISVIDANTPANGNFPVNPGGVAFATSNEFHGSVYVSITIAGPTQDGSRALSYFDPFELGGRRRCQQITGSGVYVFHNVNYVQRPYITTSAGECGEDED